MDDTNNNRPTLIDGYDPLMDGVAESSGDTDPEYTIDQWLYNKHYILTDDSGRITDGWSDGPHPDRDTAGAICINDQGGYQFRLFPDGEENPALYDMDGIPLYKWDGSQVIRRTAEEIEADRAAIPEPPPSQAERDRADIDFLAAMMGVSL